jgi:hypothetical protein
MAVSLSASATAGVLVALCGVVPLGWFAVRSIGESGPEPVAATVAVEDVEPTPVEVTPPAVGEIDDAVSRVLYASGNAEAVGERATELPPEVVRVLVYYDVTLAVPVAPAPEAAP